MLYSPAALPQSLSPDTLLVTCLCADWCDTCKEYQAKFTILAERYPDVLFMWLDIEEHDAFIPQQIDIENFPTLLIEKQAGVFFFGVMLPHIDHLERLLHHLPEQPIAQPPMCILSAHLA